MNISSVRTKRIQIRLSSINNFFFFFFFFMFFFAPFCVCSNCVCVCCSLYIHIIKFIHCEKKPNAHKHIRNYFSRAFFFFNFENFIFSKSTHAHSFTYAVNSISLIRSRCVSIVIAFLFVVHFFINNNFRIRLASFSIASSRSCFLSIYLYLCLFGATPNQCVELIN